MAKVAIDIAMSLDGYVAGPNDGPEHSLGENGGGRIMGWDHTERQLYSQEPNEAKYRKD